MTEIKFLESCGQSLLDQNGLDEFNFFCGVAVLTVPQGPPLPT